MHVGPTSPPWLRWKGKEGPDPCRQELLEKLCFSLQGAYSPMRVVYTHGNKILVLKKQCLKHSSPIWAVFHTCVQVLELGSNEWAQLSDMGLGPGLCLSGSFWWYC